MEFPDDKAIFWTASTSEWSKIFSVNQISRMHKNYSGECSFDCNLHFLKKKKSFSDFWGFLKISCPVAKSEIGTRFYTVLLNIWHLCWPRVRVHIEMGDLRPRTPCVKSVNIFTIYLISFVCRQGLVNIYSMRNKLYGS